MQINLHLENDAISEQEVEFALDPIGDGELLESFESWNDIMKVLWQQCKLEKREKIWILHSVHLRCLCSLLNISLKENKRFLNACKSVKVKTQMYT